MPLYLLFCLLCVFLLSFLLNLTCNTNILGLNSSRQKDDFSSAVAKSSWGFCLESLTCFIYPCLTNSFYLLCSCSCRHLTKTSGATQVWFWPHLAPLLPNKTPQRRKWRTPTCLSPWVIHVTFQGSLPLWKENLKCLRTNVSSHLLKSPLPGNGNRLLSLRRRQNNQHPLSLRQPGQQLLTPSSSVSSQNH